MDTRPSDSITYWITREEHLLDRIAALEATVKQVTAERDKYQHLYRSWT